METLRTPTFILLAATALLSATVAAPSAVPGTGDAAKAAPAAKTVPVTIDNFSFTPATLTIAPGTQVTWTNHDDVPHTVVSTTGRFKSRALDTDDKFSYTFTVKGTYAYFCSVHPMMTAKIIVK